MTWSKLEEVFIELGLPYSRQGSYKSNEEYPESFYTFWNYDVPGDGWYDNKPARHLWRWRVYYYTSRPETLYDMIDKFILIAKEKGFVLEGKGEDIPSDRPDYAGRMIIAIYTENH